MAGRGSALSPAVARSTDPRALRKQTIGRGLIALVWASADLAQVGLGGGGGVGDQPGDGPFVGFGTSAIAGAVLLCGLAIVNFRAVSTVADRARQGRLLTQARLLRFLCGVRLVAAVPLLAALRSLGQGKDRIPQTTFLGLVMLALLDAAVALAIAAGTVGALRRSMPPTPPPQF